ncbi:MAG: pyridoxamine 5'-phosphate oxidase family protein [Syntrophales bacterium]|jgi:nitroimidazol reductase NimA-like FMN-containing flavoprotein (pyridoxamine 5'-phosphate oxidase superfamily)|nr:pyridoxamine 5'-phosphate oxidase family protein [Syntrophales bacterium]MDY0044982.1 pyridoxamine 5'-phosphate oxidase family protein [Syntrophales bacterium]
MDLHHPKRMKNEIIDAEEIKAIITKGNHATIALSKDDIPYIVTLSYGFDFENNSFYFHCAHDGDKLEYIKENQKVCATIIEDHGYLKGECNHDYASLIIRGRMIIVEDLEEKKHGLNILLQHLEDDPDPIVRKYIKNDKSYNFVTIIKLVVDSIIGKKYIG